jgi:hypothetical protein
VLIGVIILMPHGIAGALHRLSRLRPAHVAEAIRRLPGALRQTAERFSWAWDIRPSRDNGAGEG